MELETDQDNVPKVMRMCIEEVEKRDLNTKGIYSVSFSSVCWDSCLLSQSQVDLSALAVVQASGIHPNDNFPADMNSHSVAARGSKVKNHFRSALQTIFIMSRRFSRSAIAIIANVSFLKFVSRTIYRIFQSHCLCSLCRIIETTDRIEVSGFHISSTFTF